MHATTTPELESRLSDTATAFSHQSSFDLFLRWSVFVSMRFPRLSNLVQGLVLANIQNALGRFLASFSAKLFMGGEDLRECHRVLRHLEKYGAMGILDYLVEGEDSPQGRDETLREIALAIDFAGDHPAVPFVACKPSALMDLTVLAKVQAGADLTPEEAEVFAQGKARLRGLVERASKKDVRLFVDAEWVYMQTAADTIVEELMAEFNRERPVVYTTIQMYRKDRLGYLKELLARSKKEGWIAAFKLVRGAYMEYERQENAIDPIHDTIQDTHAAFDRAVCMSLDALDHAALVVATHNRQSVVRTLAEMERRSMVYEHPRVEFAQLLGMSDLLTYNLAALGARGYKYVPYGPLHEAVPYLVRRAQENSAIQSESGREQGAVQREIWRRIFG